MIVIKLGGSLTTSTGLTSCFNRVNQHYRNDQVIIVPGGGAFADQVRIAQRQWHVDDLTAHHMAILAMQQMALLFKALQPQWQLLSTLTDIQKSMSSVLIWSPLLSELNAAGIQPSWDITSDSLAAWMAKQVNATELILVKSAAVTADATIADLQNQGVIDAGFHLFAASHDFKINIQHYQQF